VDINFRGRGLGSALLGDALQRVLTMPVATFALLVDAKDEEAVAFYRYHRFQMLAGKPRVLFIPIATAERLFQ
jgi:ribosomal protein S18 acetylase RimI-like enzyme